MSVERPPEGPGVLGADDYDRLRRAADTHREDVVVRLAAEVGLHPAEVTRVRPADVLSHGDHYFLRVRPTDDRPGREAYLPAPVEHALRKYARSAGVAPDEPLVDVSPRRVQMLVADVAARAAEATGRSVFEDLSTRDLRRYHARRLLVERGIDPRVVLAVGRYDRPEQLAEHLEPADRETVAAAFDRTGGDLAGTRTRTRRDPRRLGAVAERFRPATDALAEAATTATVEQVACEGLVGSAYRGAWLLDPTGGEAELRATAGAVGDLPGATTEGDGRAVVDAAVDEQVVRSTAVGGATATVVPVVRDGSVYGALCVVPDAPVGDAERDLLAAYGIHVAEALARVEHRRLLLADTVTELTFESAGGFLGTGSGALGCAFRLEGLAPAGGGGLLHYVTLRGAPPDAALDRASGDPAVEDARLVSDHPEGSLLELVLADSLAGALVDHGGTVRELVAEEGTVRLVGEVAGEADVRAVVDDVREPFPDTRLVAKREVERPARTGGTFRAGLDDRLTDKQASVLRAAYYAGYFEWPRETTAEELADSVGVSSPTLHNHLRRAQQKLLTVFLGSED
ncbi:bacterio-opsin activator [Halobacteriales archaeon QS_5_70_17]|nr:MAG: bacterio-opsin activator [Halobacteriales archaeon QS_5_70_17]